MTRAGVVGAAGYAAGELLRILAWHPELELTCAVSESQAGKPIHDVHRDLRGDVHLAFARTLDLDAVDAVFLCRGHGQAAGYLDANPVVLDKPVVDLSTDFRPRDNARDFTYGLPELNREAIRAARHVANPGCFATALQLAFLPLAAAGKLTADLHVTAVTGSTGAGQRPGPTTHFAYRTSNLSIYKLFGHQHLAEITESLRQAQPDFNAPIRFVPVRGDFARGIFASCYTAYPGSLERARSTYEEYYAGHPFVHVTTDAISLKEVVGTNKCVLQLHVADGLIHITSIIDNLVKGAAGQAVQNMNLVLGIEERSGLGLKSVGY